MHGEAYWRAQAEALLAANAFLSETLKGMSEAMSVLSEAALARTQALAAAAHLAAGEIAELKAKVAELEGSSVDPATLQQIIDTADAATAELSPASDGSQGA